MQKIAIVLILAFVAVHGKTLLLDKPKTNYLRSIVVFDNDNRFIKMFIVPDQLTNFDNANDVCETRAGKDFRLATINSANEWLAVISHIDSDAVYQTVWTSGNDLIKNGDYFWKSTNLPFGSFNAWPNNIPPRKPFDSCVAVVKDYTYGFVWDEQHCSNRNKVLCEKV